MKIAISGAAGLVGKEFARHFSNEHQVLALKHSDLDITDAQAVSRLIFDERPALIINCAVLGVDACELETALAWSVNVAGAENLAKAAAEINAEVLHLSTNYVFDGKRKGDSFYTVEDAPNPINVYGQTKLAGERAVRAASRRSFIIRTSWIFGIGKKNFFSTAHRSLKAARQVRAITDVWASSTYVRDLVLRVAEILPRRHYSTYHVVNDGLCSYYDFALEAARILKFSDAEVMQLIEPVKSSATRQNAQRPRYTPIRCIVSDELGFSALRDWREALAEYIHSDCTLNE
ncbi:MAG: dTDP-4-dehydrorhamnose reductase [Acidobacteria bacterium]|nr:dTDP-4-dehydrorhamnose reductase [Acidobacteriota bacterium]MCA1639688.1 dTDP-4-dehydrorhamnose reductase [Acidobacteriota bacterium]